MWKWFSNQGYWNHGPLPTEKFYGDGFVLTGNVTEFLDPVFSSGVTLATVSSQIAANLVIRKLNGENVDWDKEYTEPMMQGVNTFRSYVMAWYEGTLDTIFFADNQVAKNKKHDLFCIGRLCLGY